MITRTPLPKNNQQPITKSQKPDQPKDKTNKSTKHKNPDHRHKPIPKGQTQITKGPKNQHHATIGTPTGNSVTPCPQWKPLLDTIQT